uniref:Uncharacterized protein n=1 Tax=Helianthus annuus TaxID=4232 RepID=A0A251SUI2_HELAN
MSTVVPLDYSLRSYLEVIFLDPMMKIKVQGSLAYKRVGSMIHNGENSHGLVGVIDVTDVMLHTSTIAPYPPSHHLTVAQPPPSHHFRIIEETSLSPNLV